MSSPTVILHDSVKDALAELWFAEPAGFTALPLDALLPEPGSPAAEELRSTVAPFLAAAPNELARQKFITDFAAVQQLLCALREVGTVHCSVGLHSDDADAAGPKNGQPLLSWFTISWRDVAVAPRGVLAARAVTSSEPRTDIEYRELPCGPATFSESVMAVPTQGDLPRQPLSQFHAYLPQPDCRRLAVLALSTTRGAAHREQYRAIVRQIAATVSFENPLPDVSDEE
ncbi:hypothetical protein [Streptomyces sp. NPDC088794]|uniref:hypothetical protein n=1 Tax=Streptomyces sp. NPDC088794 TaxID=3365902 RepID=UPI003806DD39